MGLWPMMITAELVRVIGRKRALEMMLSGVLVDAQRACDIGLITRAVPADILAETVGEVCEQIAGASPAVVKLGLRSFAHCCDGNYKSDLEYLEHELQRVLGLEDAREGLAAFVAKRTPVWRGR